MPVHFQAETQPLMPETMNALALATTKVTPSPKQHIFEDETPPIPKPEKALRRMQPCDLANKFEEASKDDKVDGKHFDHEEGRMIVGNGLALSGLGSCMGVVPL